MSSVAGADATRFATAVEIAASRAVIWSATDVVVYLSSFVDSLYTMILSVRSSATLTGAT